MIVEDTLKPGDPVVILMSNHKKRVREFQRGVVRGFTSRGWVLVKYVPRTGTFGATILKAYPPERVAREHHV